MIYLDNKWNDKCDECNLFFPCKSALFIHRLDEHNDDKPQSIEESDKLKNIIEP